MADPQALKALEGLLETKYDHSEEFEVEISAFYDLNSQLARTLSETVRRQVEWNNQKL